MRQIHNIKNEYPQGVLVNEIAQVNYNPKTGEYIAFDLRTYEDPFSNTVCRSITGDFKRCKKAFDKYTNTKVNKRNLLIK